MKKLHSKSDIHEKIAESLRPAWRIGIVYSSFYEDEMKTMVDSAITTLKAIGVQQNNISEYPVPGSFEIPLIGAKLASSHSVDALIGLGIIVEGETHHARLVAENTARGIMDVQTRYALPFANEVLYVDTLELAKSRLDKGKDAALCVLHCLAQLKELQS